MANDQNTPYEKIGPYEKIAQIGAGGMAVVWRARKPGLNRDLAIKQIAPNMRNRQRAVEQFISEVRLSSTLTHSNIVRVVECCDDPANPYIVMDWIDGLTLSELCTELRKDQELLPVPVVAFIIGEVLQGLEYAHTVESEHVGGAIIHRDISPQNVMISVSGEVKILDFGIARAASEETSGHSIKGKARYMPPEQYSGVAKDPTVDLFAVGAIFHELFDGQVFRGEEVTDHARFHNMVINGEYPELTRAPDELPPELDALRVKLLAADPKDRPQSAQAALELLQKWRDPGNGRHTLRAILRRITGVHSPRASIPTIPPTAILGQQDTFLAFKPSTHSQNTQDPAAFDHTASESARPTLAPDTDGRLRPVAEAGGTMSDTRERELAIHAPNPWGVVFSRAGIGALLVLSTCMATIIWIRGERQPTPAPMVVVNPEPVVSPPIAEAEPATKADEPDAITPASAGDTDSNPVAPDIEASSDENPKAPAETPKPPEKKPKSSKSSKSSKVPRCQERVISKIDNLISNQQLQCKPATISVSSDGHVEGGALHGHTLAGVGPCTYTETCH